MKYGISFLVLFLSTITFAGKTKPKAIAVLIVDSPIDMSHPDLHKKVDKAALKRYKVTIHTGGTEKQGTLWDVHQAIEKQFHASLSREDLNTMLDYINEKDRALAGLSDSESQKKWAKQSAIAQTDPLFFQKLSLVSQAVHGTHVAGVIVDNASNRPIRLLEYPISGMATATVSQLANHNTERSRKAKEGRWELIDQMIQKEGVRVVNLSIATSVEGARKGIEAALGFTESLKLGRDHIQRVARKAMETEFNAIKKVIENNPNTIFVIGAGNEKIDLDTVPDSDLRISKLNLDNVIKVAAIERSGKIWDSSTRGRKSVDIGALGVGVEGPRHEGGRIFLSGTSVSTAVVSGAFVRVLSDNPELSPKEAIHHLRTCETVSGCGVRPFVRDGKVLKFESLQRTPRFVVIAKRDWSKRKGDNMPPMEALTMELRLPELVDIMEANPGYPLASIVEDALNETFKDKPNVLNNLGKGKAERLSIQYDVEKESVVVNLDVRNLSAKDHDQIHADVQSTPNVIEECFIPALKRRL